LKNLNFEPGSFRDPSGRVFYKNNRVFRSLSSNGVKRFEFLKKNNLLEDLIKKEYLINSKEHLEDINTLQLNNKYKILEHEKISFISYPYEWTFTQLKDAAIFHLDLQLYLLKKNAKLIDASAYNIQFKRNKPIFIDLLSIDEYKEGEYWYAHKQFCENFLNPLVLSSKKGINFNNWFRGNLEGISTNEIYSVLRIFDFFSPTLFFHIFLLNKFDEKTKIDPNIINKKISTAKKLTKKSYSNILVQLKNYITNLKNKKKISSWGNYSENNTYKFDEEEKKINLINDFVDRNNIKFLVDLGCNDGKYSKYAASQKNIEVVGIDFDLNALDRAFVESKNNKLNFFPIFLDFSNPSSNLGWNNKERKSFEDRVNFDSMIALAVIHHLVIAKNIPIEDAIKWLTSLAPRGLIEFVPKDDPTVKIMLKLKGDLFPEYNEENFQNILSKFCTIKNITKITSSERKIYEYTK